RPSTQSDRDLRTRGGGAVEASGPCRSAGGLLRRRGQVNSTIRQLRALDKALVKKSFPVMSPFWTSTFERFISSGKRQLVARVGRRGGKSSSLCRFAVAFARAYDVTKIPPGDTGVVAFVSVNRDEAAQRLRTIKAILDAI